ncbi:MAG TPA: acyltransferase [Limnobacter sp.]|nr:acyltransferase [Limnobacter sp.]
MNPEPAASWRTLDGVRAISIALVLACHLLPLGPKTWIDLNIATGHMGMAMFFGLSGFLIAHKLQTEPGIKQFAVNRFLRIFPLLWLVLLIHFVWKWPNVDPKTLALNAAVWINHSRAHYLPETKHLWSVCVEVHFYVLAAIVFFIFKRRGVLMLVGLGLLLAVHRYLQAAIFNTTTIFRLDELLIPMLAGWVWHSTSPMANRLKRFAAQCPPGLPLLALAVCSMAPPVLELTILRPLWTTALLLALLYNPGTRTALAFAHSGWRWLSRHAYALYLIHPFLLVTWLASGDKLTEYAKRPLLFAVLALLAYLSTKYYERFFIELGKRWFKPKAAEPSPPQFERA